MGFGGVTAVGCSLGNGVTGLALMSVGSMLAVTGIVGGAWLALAAQMRDSDVKSGSGVTLASTSPS